MIMERAERSCMCFALQFKKHRQGKVLHWSQSWYPRGCPFHLREQGQPGRHPRLARPDQIARLSPKRERQDHMTHPLYTPSTARSPKTINFEPLQRGADAAEAAIRAAEDQLVAATKAQAARDALYAKRDR